MVVLILLTVFFQMIMNNSYGPLIEPLPLSLADKTYKAPQAAPEIPPTNDTVTGKAKETDTAGETSPQDDSKQAGDVQHEEKEAPHPDIAPAPAIQEQSTEHRRQQVSEEEYGFAHPAASRPQRIIWLPLDPLGLANEEEKANKEAGVDAAVQDAVMNEKGNVDISGPPPDEIQE